MISSKATQLGQFTMDYRNVQGLYYLVSPKMQRHRRLSGSNVIDGIGGTNSFQRRLSNFGQNLSTSLTSLNISSDNNDSFETKNTFFGKFISF